MWCESAREVIGNKDKFKSCCREQHPHCASGCCQRTKESRGIVALIVGLMTGKGGSKAEELCGSSENTTFTGTQIEESASDDRREKPK